MSELGAPPTIGFGKKLALAAAIVAYLASGLFPYLASLLLVPLVGVIPLMALWVFGFAVVAILVRRRSWWALAGLPAALVFWWVYVTAGGAIFGWTA